MKKNILLVVNPCSGKKLGRKSVGDIIRYISDSNNTITVKETSKQGDATCIVEKLGNNYDLVICSGGDGTLNEVINGIMHLDKRIPVAYIPNGTTNDTAKTLSLPITLSGISKTIKANHYNKCDTGLFNSRYFFCAVSFGFGAEASFNTKQSLKNKIGHIAYIISNIKKLPDIKPIEMCIEYDNQTISGKFIFGAIINTKSVGGIFKIDKDIFRINDGKFEIVLVRKLNNITELPHVLRKLQQQDYDGKQVILIQANTIRLKSSHKISWLIDGENGGKLSEVNIVNISQSIDICSPESNIYIKESQ